MKNLEKFAIKCIKFVDANGVIENRGSTPFSEWLLMHYKQPKFSMHIHITRSPYGNGFAGLVVKADRKIVFKVEGCYIAAPFDLVVKKYISGAWEKKIR